MKNILERVEAIGDLWQPVLDPGIDMSASLNNLKETWPKLSVELRDS